MVATAPATQVGTTQARGVHRAPDAVRTSGERRQRENVFISWHFPENVATEVQRMPSMQWCARRTPDSFYAWGGKAAVCGWEGGNQSRRPAGAGQENGSAVSNRAQDGCAVAW